MLYILSFKRYFRDLWKDRTEVGALVLPPTSVPLTFVPFFFLRKEYRCLSNVTILVL